MVNRAKFSVHTASSEMKEERAGPLKITLYILEVWIFPTNLNGWMLGWMDGWMKEWWKDVWTNDYINNSTFSPLFFDVVFFSSDDDIDIPD